MSDSLRKIRRHLEEISQIDLDPHIEDVQEVKWRAAQALAILKEWQPTALWKCDSCLYTAYEGAVEDPGHITMHIDPDTDERCVGRMLRYELVRSPKYPDPAATGKHGYELGA